MTTLTLNPAEAATPVPPRTMRAARVLAPAKRIQGVFGSRSSAVVTQCARASRKSPGEEQPTDENLRTAVQSFRSWTEAYDDLSTAVESFRSWTELRDSLGERSGGAHQVCRPAVLERFCRVAASLSASSVGQPTVC